MKKIITSIRSAIADINYANERLFEIQTGIERRHRNGGDGHR